MFLYAATIHASRRAGASHRTDAGAADGSTRLPMLRVLPMLAMTVLGHVTPPHADALYIFALASYGITVTFALGAALADPGARTPSRWTAALDGVFLTALLLAHGGALPTRLLACVLAVVLARQIERPRNARLALGLLALLAGIAAADGAVGSFLAEFAFVGALGMYAFQVARESGRLATCTRLARMRADGRRSVPVPGARRAA